MCPHRGCAVRVQVVAQKTEESDMADHMLLLVSLLALLRFDFVRFSRVRAALESAPDRIGVFDRDVLLEFSGRCLPEGLITSILVRFGLVRAPPCSRTELVCVCES